MPGWVWLLIGALLGGGIAYLAILWYFGKVYR